MLCDNDVLHIFPRLCVHQQLVSSLQSALVGVFTPQE